MAKRYLSDIIGEDYKNWKIGQSVLACTSTGSGKTWFVLNRLLPYAKEQGKHVVYYCNRKFLNMQVQASARKRIYDELGEDKEGLATYLHIRTYQHTEHQKDFPNVVDTDEEGTKYVVDASLVLFYVFDEAMYMVQDAAFNSSTRFWYSKAAEMNRKNAICVFLTATPEPFFLYQKSRMGDIGELCQNFIARYSVYEDIYYNRWSYYLHFAGVEQPRLKEHLGDPYAALFAWVKDAYTQNSGWADYFYKEERSLSECYDYADTYYFDDIDSLAHMIAKSVKERQKKSPDRKANKANTNNGPVEGSWLVFVRTKEDAKSLQLALQTLDCSSVVITAAFTKRYDGKPAKRKNTNKDIFNKLVNEEYLSIPVLISTSVLDCGITLRASNVNHLALCQPNKTSFLQMLGRIRVQEGERINLYIQSYTPKQIVGFSRKYLSDFLFLVHFWMINQKSHKSYFMQWREPNMFVDGANDYIDFLPAATREWLISELERDKDKWRFLNEKTHQQRRHYDLQSVKDLCVNELAVIHYLGQIYYFKEVLPEYSKDKYSFLKEQLSWIGKTYDPTRWIDYQAPRDKLCDFLEQILQIGEPMDKCAQADFREKCYEYLKCFREPPESFLEEKRRHSVGSDKYPGMSKLNEIFIDAGIPYQIESKQNKKQLIDKQTGKPVIDPKTGKPKIDNTTYWYIRAIDPVIQRTLEKQKKSEKLRRQERLAEKRKLKEQTPESRNEISRRNTFPKKASLESRNPARKLKQRNKET